MCTRAAVWLAPVPLDAEHPFVSNHTSQILVLLWRPGVLGKEKKLDSRCIVSLCAPVSDSDQDLELPSLGIVFIQRWTRRRCHAFLALVSPAGDYLRAQPIR